MSAVVARGWGSNSCMAEGFGVWDDFSFGSLGGCGSSDVEDFAEDVLPDVGFETVFEDEIHFLPQEIAEFVFDLTEGEKSQSVVGIEADQDVDVAIGVLVATSVGSKQFKLLDGVLLGEFLFGLGEEGFQV